MQDKYSEVRSQREDERSKEKSESPKVGKFGRRKDGKSGKREVYEVVKSRILPGERADLGGLYFDS